MKYRSKALILVVLLSIFFIVMYELQALSYYKALVADGALDVKFGHQRLFNNLITGFLIAFLPYELLFCKTSRWYRDWYGEENKKKNFWTSVSFLILNVFLGVLGCFVRAGNDYSWGTPGIHIQYVMLLFVCFSMGIIISTREIENKIIKSVIRCLSIIFNAFLMYYYSGVMGQAIITLIALCATAIVYDYMTNQFSWKETIVTGLVGIVGTTVGLLLKDYHTYEELTQFGKNIFSFKRVDLYMGTGYFILYIFLAVAMAATLVFAIRMMKNVSKIRTGLLIGATALYMCAFVYIFLSMFGIVPCSEIQMFTNRIHVVALVLVLRTFVVIPTPKYEEKPSFVERLISQAGEYDEDVDFIMEQIDGLRDRQNLILKYLMSIDNRLERLELSENSEDYEKLKAEIEEDRATLEKNNIPLNKKEFCAQLKEIYDKKNNEE